MKGVGAGTHAKVWWTWLCGGWRDAHVLLLSPMSPSFTRQLSAVRFISGVPPGVSPSPHSVHYQPHIGRPRRGCAICTPRSVHYAPLVLCTIHPTSQTSSTEDVHCAPLILCSMHLSFCALSTTAGFLGGTWPRHYAPHSVHHAPPVLCTIRPTLAGRVLVCVCVCVCVLCVLCVCVSVVCVCFCGVCVDVQCSEAGGGQRGSRCVVVVLRTPSLAASFPAPPRPPSFKPPVFPRHRLHAHWAAAHKNALPTPVPP